MADDDEILAAFRRENDTDDDEEIREQDLDDEDLEHASLRGDRPDYDDVRWGAVDIGDE